MLLEYFEFFFKPVYINLYSPISGSKENIQTYKYGESNKKQKKKYRGPKVTPKFSSVEFCTGPWAKPGFSE